MEQHLNELVRNGNKADAERYLSLLDDPQYQEAAITLLNLKQQFDEQGIVIFNPDASTTYKFVNPNGQEVLVTEASAARVQLIQGLSAVDAYIKTLPTEDVGIVMQSLDLMSGGIVKKGFQLAVETGLSFATEDVQKQVTQGVKNTVGATLLGDSSAQVYQLNSDQELFAKYKETYERLSAAIADDPSKYESLSAEDKLAYNNLKNFVTDPNAQNVREYHGQAGGAVDIVTVLVMGTGAAALGLGKKDGDSGNNPSDDRLDFTGPYDPKKTREDLEAAHGVENVSSTTVPKDPHQRANDDPEKNIEVIHGANGGKAVKVGYTDPKTGEEVSANIPYNDRGLPVFDDVSKYTTDIDMSKNYDGQMRQATRDLRDAINSGKVDASQFTPEQLRNIQAGNKTIKGYTWHHNADSHNMQLIPRAVHDAASHIGQGSLNQGN